jgi:hypothetical protein
MAWSRRCLASSERLEGRLDEHVRHRVFTAHNVVQGVARRLIEQDVDVGEANIAINDEHAATGVGERHREVDRQVSLTHASLPGGDSDDAQRALPF